MESGWLEWCKEEIERAGLFDPEVDFYGGQTGKALLELCELFDKQNHSSRSAAVVVFLFKRLIEHNPLTPLTGEDDEWIELKPGLYQNKRCPTVFKQDGKAYQIDYYVFREPDGTCYTNSKSKKEIKSFPYWPETKVINVKKRIYTIWPMEIKSKTDGDRHYITASELMLLYHVDPRRDEYVIVRSEEDIKRLYSMRKDAEIITLMPREDGKYCDVHEECYGFEEGNKEK